MTKQEILDKSVDMLLTSLDDQSSPVLGRIENEAKKRGLMFDPGFLITGSVGFLLADQPEKIKDQINAIFITPSWFDEDWGMEIQFTDGREGVYPDPLKEVKRLKSLVGKTIEETVDNITGAIIAQMEYMKNIAIAEVS